MASFTVFAIDKPNEVPDRIKNSIETNYPILIQKTFFEGRVVCYIFLQKYYQLDEAEKTFKRIKTRFESRKPDKLSLQSDPEERIECYVFIQDDALSQVPSDILTMIKNRYRSSYPDDYTMQRALVEKDIGLYLRKAKRP